MSLSVAVLLGSVRQDRVGLRVARFLLRALEERGHRPTLVDPMASRLPLLDRMYKEHPPGEAPAVLEELATLYRGADAFLMVSAEYNHGIPPALKNLLDHFLEEYFWRPSAIACYSAGSYGGVRAAMQLRMTLAELGMPSIPSLLPFPRAAASLDEEGRPLDPAHPPRADRFLDELEWYAEALRDRRSRGVPY
ncbi:NADPH-dependent FMN reductase [Rhizosaccharibacter radicis]|uniref:NAD(P)H-dependent oxidoreductase n=1 Tax=Rhizosaccharibacter radicis TaxID=2782605 RepID=A0ABT1VZ02_9PROT|nr:NAD(P)H-dependent oxidoreductase [Acetobacteraceae bacterium KSS12]